MRGFLRILAMVVCALAGVHYRVTAQCCDLTDAAQYPAQECEKRGWSVAVSGTHAIVGSPGAQGSNPGAVRFLERSGTWVLGPSIAASDPAAGAEFGTSVSIDGDTAVVGAPSHPGTGGRAYVFVREPDGSWVETQILAAPFQVAAFGMGVAISGHSLVVGAPESLSGGFQLAGRAFVFERIGCTWVQTAELHDNTPEFLGTFGYGVAIEGNELAVGAVGGFDGPGEVHVFRRQGPGQPWLRQQVLLEDGGQGNGTAASGP